MEQSKPAKKLLGEQIEEALLQYIQSTPISIGEKLPNEFELGEMFQVGRSTIREAVKALVTKGILEVRRGDGTYVRSHRTIEEDPLGLSLLDDKFKLALELFEVRLMLEPEIAALAANHATEEEKRQLVSLCDAVEHAYLAGEDHIPLDIEFHNFIARCSRNRVVETVLPVINTAVMTFANITRRSLMQETIDTHRDITHSILEQDSVGARCAMITHLTFNRQKILRLWEEHKAGMNAGKRDSSDHCDAQTQP